MKTLTTKLDVRLHKDIKRNFNVCKNCKHLSNGLTTNVAQCWIVEKLDNKNNHLIHKGNIYIINDNQKGKWFGNWDNQGVPYACK